MRTTAGESTTQDREDSGTRAPLVAAAVLVTVLAVLHHADHVIRGDLVVANGLPEIWNHSGWPFQERVNPFTASLGIYLLLVPGIALTLLGRVAARYWIAVALVLEAILLFVHFFPARPETEFPSVIYGTYDGGVAGVLALVDVFALVAAIAVLGVLAGRGWRRSRARKTVSEP